MLGVFAEFETNLRRERQLEGIAKAKAASVYTTSCTVGQSIELLPSKSVAGRLASIQIISPSSPMVPPAPVRYRIKT